MQMEMLPEMELKKKTVITHVKTTQLLPQGQVIPMGRTHVSKNHLKYFLVPQEDIQLVN